MRRLASRPRARDPGGRLALGAVGIALVVVGIVRADWSSVPLLVIGSLLVILFAFHSRIEGPVDIGGKVKIPITGEHPPATPAERAAKRQAERSARGLR